MRLTPRGSILILFILLVATTVQCVLPMPGGWVNQSPTSPKVKEFANYAHDLINQRTNSLTHRRLLHIHEASSQVVAGVKYKLVFDSGYTKCRRNGDMANEVISSCDLDKERVSHCFVICLLTVCPPT